MRTLDTTITSVALLQAGGALQQAYVAFHGNAVNVALALLFAAGIPGLVRRVRWGRNISVAFLWIAIFIAFAHMNPFLAGDLMAQGIEPPSPWLLGGIFAGVCAVALACLHFLGRYKTHFRAAWW